MIRDEIMVKVSLLHRFALSAFLRDEIMFCVQIAATAVLAVGDKKGVGKAWSLGDFHAGLVSFTLHFLLSRHRNQSSLCCGVHGVCQLAVLCSGLLYKLLQ